MKFRLGAEAWGNKRNVLFIAKMTSFVLFSQALVPSLNFTCNKFKLLSYLWLVCAFILFFYINTETKGAIERVCIKWVKFRGNEMACFLHGEGKLSVLSECP